MDDLTLSQDEIEALLRQTDEDVSQTKPQDESMPAVTELLYAAMLSASSAMELSLGVEVQAQTPVGSDVTGHRQEELVVTAVQCSGDGFSGQMHLIVTVAVARGLIDTLRGMASESESLSETELLTIGEVMADVVGDLASHLSSVSGSSISMQTEDSFTLAAGEYDFIERQICPGLKLAYPLQIGESLAAYVEQWISRPLAKHLDAINTEPTPVRRKQLLPTPPPVAIKPPTYGQLEASPGRSEASNIDMLFDIPLEVTVELGRTRRNVREVLALGPGSVLELEKIAGEPVDVMVNGKLLAKGEVVVIDENFGVRITEIVTQAERVRRLGG